MRGDPGLRWTVIVFVALLFYAALYVGYWIIQFLKYWLVMGKHYYAPF